MEEENEHQEEISLEKEECNKNEICSVCNSRGSVFRCEECNNWLHESCTQSTTPFLCKCCLRKKRLRERESETDDLSGQEDSNIEVKQGNRDIEAVYSASPQKMSVGPAWDT